MASLKDVERVADDLEKLVGQLRSELQNGDFDRLTQLADEISEHADNAAETFSSVNEALMSRISELSGNRRGGGQSQSQSQRSSGGSRQKSESSSR
jgi:ABC-type transporter Mla subunit MlaD